MNIKNKTKKAVLAGGGGGGGGEVCVCVSVCIGGVVAGFEDLERGEEHPADDRTTRHLTSCLNGTIYKEP